MKQIGLITLLLLSVTAFAGGSGGIKAIAEEDRSQGLLIIDLDKIKSINTLSVGIIRNSEIKGSLDRLNKVSIKNSKLQFSINSNEILDVETYFGIITR